MAKKAVRNKKITGERKLERELLYVLGFFALLVLIFLLASAFFKNLNQVEYEGLVFTKERFEGLEVYKYAYSFKVGGQVINYNLYLRNNPAENDVPLIGDPIEFNGRTIYITLDTTKLAECRDASISVGSLTNFFRDNQFSVRSGNMDFTEAAVRGHEHVTCESHDRQNVVQIYRGDETKITSDGQCFSIEVGDDCKILEAVEKFQVHSFLDAQNIN